MLSSALPAYRFDGEETTQLPVLPPGQGNGISGPGSLTAKDMWCGKARDGGAEKDAEIRPAKATSNAKMRMAVFIFGNLIY